MKTNIQQVKYNENSTVPDTMPWWSWEEVCDDCGKVIFKFKDRLSSQEPDTKHKDYCLNCLHKKLDAMNWSK